MEQKYAGKLMGKYDVYHVLAETSNKLYDIQGIFSGKGMPNCQPNCEESFYDPNLIEHYVSPHYQRF